MLSRRVRAPRSGVRLPRGSFVPPSPPPAAATCMRRQDRSDLLRSCQASDRITVLVTRHAGPSFLDSGPRNVRGPARKGSSKKQVGAWIGVDVGGSRRKRTGREANRRHSALQGRCRADQPRPSPAFAGLPPHRISSTGVDDCRRRNSWIVSASIWLGLDVDWTWMCELFDWPGPTNCANKTC